MLFKGITNQPLATHVCVSPGWNKLNLKIEEKEPQATKKKRNSQCINCVGFGFGFTMKRTLNGFYRNLRSIISTFMHCSCYSVIICVFLFTESECTYQPTALNDMDRYYFIFITIELSHCMHEQEMNLNINTYTRDHSFISNSNE